MKYQNPLYTPSLSPQNPQQVNNRAESKMVINTRLEFIWASALLITLNTMDVIKIIMQQMIISGLSKFIVFMQLLYLFLGK